MGLNLRLDLIIVLGFGVLIGCSSPDPPDSPAKLLAYQGTLWYQGPGASYPTEVTEFVRSGRGAATNYDGQAYFELSGGGSMIIDSDTSVKFDMDSVELKYGRAHFDLQGRREDRQFSVTAEYGQGRVADGRTGHTQISAVGTVARFEVRAPNNQGPLQVRVRSGEILVQDPRLPQDLRISARGTLSLDENGEPSLGSLEPDSSTWDWAAPLDSLMLDLEEYVGTYGFSPSGIPYTTVRREGDHLIYEPVRQRGSVLRALSETQFFTWGSDAEGTQISFAKNQSGQVTQMTIELNYRSPLTVAKLSEDP